MASVQSLAEKKGSIDGNSLKILDLSKVYDQFVAVDLVSLDIKQGEFMTFLGSSGSGKSTTLLAIAGFLEPTSGDILLSGESILNKPPHQQNIGMVFQQYSLFPHMTIFENIAFPLKMRKVPKPEIAERVSDILKLIELEHFSHRKPSELSGGQQQRVALARALVFRPSILLMDEPLAALDKKLREVMQTEIRRLHQQLGLTIIYVTHDQEEALKMSYRIAIFNKGKIEQLGTPLELYDRPGTQFVAEFLGDSNLFRGKVVESHGNKTIIRSDDVTVTATCDTFLSVGEEAVVMVRPEKVELSIEAASTGSCFFEATVMEAIYLGDHYKYKLDTATGRSVTVKKQIEVMGQRTIHPGDRVHVSWNPDNAIVLH